MGADPLVTHQALEFLLHPTALNVPVTPTDG